MPLNGKYQRPQRWGHAKDYLLMQWMLLQQDKLEDSFIATGMQYSVHEFINKTAKALGMTLTWSGSGIDKVTYCHSRADGNPCPVDPIVRIDTRYYHLTEVETLLGDPAKAKTKRS